MYCVCVYSGPQWKTLTVAGSILAISGHASGIVSSSQIEHFLRCLNSNDNGEKDWNLWQKSHDSWDLTNFRLPYKIEAYRNLGLQE